MRCGKRNIRPVCSPLPKPTDERQPMRIHQATSLHASSICQKVPGAFSPQTGGVNLSGARWYFVASHAAIKVTTTQTTGLHRSQPRLRTGNLATYRRKRRSVVSGFFGR